MNGDLCEWYKCEACGCDGFWKTGAANIVKKWEPSDMTVYWADGTYKTGKP